MKDLAIETDTSQVGLEAVNSRIRNQRQEDLYACVVRKQVSEGSQEKMYSVTDLEAFAVVWAVKTFR